MIWNIILFVTPIVLFGLLGKAWVDTIKSHTSFMNELKKVDASLRGIRDKCYPPAVFPPPVVKQCYLVTYALTLKNGCFLFDQVHLENDGKIDNSNYTELLNSLFGRALQRDPHVKSMAIVSLLYLGEKVVEEQAPETPGEKP